MTSESDIFDVVMLAGFVFLILEMALPAFAMLGFALGCFAVAGLLLIGSFTEDFLGIVFGLISLLGWVGLRQIFRREGDTQSADGDVNRF
jgi:membrane protein implicated in regulation of membrane protease activity